MAGADLLERPAGSTGGAAAGTTAPGGGLAEAGERGSLVIAERVVEKIARAAALGCQGVAPVSATTGRVSGAFGRTLPRVEAEVAGHRALLELEVASLWPHSTAAVASAVREAVTNQLERLADVQADAVKVAIVRIVRPQARPHETARVR